MEIQALAEMYNRPIHIYSYSTGAATWIDIGKKNSSTLKCMSSLMFFLSYRAYQHISRELQHGYTSYKAELPPWESLQFVG